MSKTLITQFYEWLGKPRETPPKPLVSEETKDNIQTGLLIGGLWFMWVLPFIVVGLILILLFR